LKFNRVLLLILSLLLLGLFLRAVDNINRRVEIASFATSIEERTPEQLENLRTASLRINNYVLGPGDVFSFNEVVGERLRRWGYQGAPSLYQGKVVTSPGGGICQLSSTIYNAALLSGFEIIERTPHLWTINSVEPGRDAAILYGKLDLKFRNNYNFPVEINIAITESKIIARVTAPQELDTNISIATEIVQVYPAPRYSGDLHSSANSSITIPSQGLDGCTVKVFRYFMKDGKLLKKEMISVDRYEPVPGKL
jgi:vancomycin resistance protein YoaR